jgi:hypothetical protein
MNLRLYSAPQHLPHHPHPTASRPPSPQGGRLERGAESAKKSARNLANHAIESPCPKTRYHSLKASKTIDAKESDALFDSGADISGHVDGSMARRPGLETRRVEIDFPAWMLAALDRQAKRIGVTRQALIRMWVGERVG